MREVGVLTEPRVWPVAVSPAILTVSVYWFPDTVDPSPYARLNDFPRALEVEEVDGL